MTKCLTEYINAISGDDVEIFEDLLGDGYECFILFFDFLKDYSNLISKMEYEKNKEDKKKSLTIKVEFTVPMKTIFKKNRLLSMWKSLGFEINHRLSGNKMTVTICYNKKPKVYKKRKIVQKKGSVK